MASILVVEDDAPIRAALTRALTDAGHVVRVETNGSDALRAAVEWQADVVVLDLGLPDFDGGDVLRMIRGISNVPVIIATARDDEGEAIALLDAGADDHMVKPYSAAQLEARIRAVLRRGVADGAVSELVCGGLRIDPARRVASVDDVSVDLSRLEFDLAAHLASRSPEVVTRRELLAEVWNQPYGGSDKTVDVHLSWLRRKLGETAAAPRFVHTVRGVGIQIEDRDAGT